MRKTKKSILSITLLIVAMALTVLPSAAPGSTGRESLELPKTITKTAQFLEKEMLASDYEGIMEWGMIGLYGAGKDVGSFAKIREAQIARGEMISEFKNTDYQRSILGALAAGKSPNAYGNKKLLESEIASQQANGKFADSLSGEGARMVNAHIWGVISLYAAGQEIPNSEKALQWLVEHQNADGGFSIDTEIKESDIDMTAMAIIAMACLGQDAACDPVQKALAYLRQQQNDDGSFGAWGIPTAESCAQVIQALTMLGIDPTGDAWVKNGGNPLTGLLQFRLDNGAFSHGPEKIPNVMATSQALVALVDYYTGQSIYQKLRDGQEPVKL
ncbi:Squalene-hopene cyclase C-terminal domain-containing protein [Desulfotomaculum arcticum]|uniref:Squalene-hopene cyclase C-terminal domain-containing protein n=1 Tax=Desulfotruncus arcticus DSM 17038 TaxID=1121424 RepID=A0A1I2QG02_9FIRM|nr:prenyltransferase/squalene oxidase repeat-containing protein [Desulfotruncus arcticus]SFG24511.1 Squalene-hopene cyclase C-terminal domain-containing protein [Desulfotomaculum arcticum] [Desulfotruncus arcticus DSM 17038]